MASFGPRQRGGKLHVLISANMRTEKIPTVPSLEISTVVTVLASCTVHRAPFLAVSTAASAVVRAPQSVSAFYSGSHQGARAAGEDVQPYRHGSEGARDQEGASFGFSYFRVHSIAMQL